MSFWIHPYTCKKCGHITNIAGGVVGTKPMGPSNADVQCSNRHCDGRGYDTFERVFPMELPMPKVRLKFMVDPTYLKEHAYIEDPVRCVVTDPEAVFLMGILGDSGREMVKAGFPFYFERQLAEKLVKAGFAKESPNVQS